MDLKTLPARCSVGGRKMQAAMEKEANTASLASATPVVPSGSYSHSIPCGAIMREPQTDLDAI